MVTTWRHLAPSGLALVLMAACQACKPASPQWSVMGTTTGEERRFDAVVIAPQVTEKAHGKTFAGAMVRQDDGTEWVVDYSPRSPFREMDGQRVLVEGSPYEPRDQALVKPHLQVRTMKIIKPTLEPSLVRVDGEEKLSGHFERYTFPEGTKLAGKTMTRFVADRGDAFWIAHGPTEPLDQPLTLTAHRVEPSPFVTRVGGPYLWITGGE